MDGRRANPVRKARSRLALAEPGCSPGGKPAHTPRCAPVDHERNPYPVSRTYATLLPIESIGKTGCPVGTSPTLRGVDGLSDSQAWYTMHRDFSQLLRTRHRVGERMDDNSSPGL